MNNTFRKVIGYIEVVSKNKKGQWQMHSKKCQRHSKERRDFLAKGGTVSTVNTFMIFLEMIFFLCTWHSKKHFGADFKYYIATGLAGKRKNLKYSSPTICMPSGVLLEKLYFDFNRYFVLTKS